MGQKPKKPTQLSPTRGNFFTPQKLTKLERGRRIELLALAWKAKVLPLYEPRASAFRQYQNTIKTLSKSIRTTHTKRKSERLAFCFANTHQRSILTGGWGWIRTSVLVRGQIYSLLPLTTRPPILRANLGLCHIFMALEAGQQRQPTKPVACPDAEARDGEKVGRLR